MPSFAICYSSTEFCTSIWCCSFPIKQLHSTLSYRKHCILLHCSVSQSLFNILWGRNSGYLRKQIQLFYCIWTSPIYLQGFFSTSMTPVHSGLFHKGEKWNFYFNNNFLLTDVIKSPSWFWQYPVFGLCWTDFWFFKVSVSARLQIMVAMWL